MRLWFPTMWGISIRQPWRYFRQQLSVGGSSQPTHAHFKAGECGLKKDTTFEAESKWTINKFQISEIVGHMNEEQLTRIAVAMAYATPIVMLAFQRGILSETRFKKILQAS